MRSWARFVLTAAVRVVIPFRPIVKEYEMQLAAVALYKQLRTAIEAICWMQKRPPDRKTTDRHHTFPVAPNIIAKDFAATEPNQKWGADISYIWTREKIAIARYIERFHNPICHHSPLDYLSPVQCERMAAWCQNASPLYRSKSTSTRADTIEHQRETL
jgi:hypothetical protein